MLIAHNQVEKRGTTGIMKTQKQIEMNRYETQSHVHDASGLSLVFMIRRA